MLDYSDATIYGVVLPSVKIKNPIESTSTERTIITQVDGVLYHGFELSLVELLTAVWLLSSVISW